MASLSWPAMVVLEFSSLNLLRVKFCRLHQLHHRDNYILVTDNMASVAFARYILD